MTYWQWLLLAVAVAAMLVLTWSGEFDSAAESRPTGPASGPTFAMERATIEQFDDRGALRYELRAERIAHYDAQGITRVVAPRLRMLEGGRTTWEATAMQGRVLSPAQDGDGAAAQVVVLEQDVALRRMSGRPVRMETESLHIRPLAKAAWTDVPVIIDADSGRTRAAGMRSDLESGRIRLVSGDRQRVTTVVRPRTS